MVAAFIPVPKGTGMLALVLAGRSKRDSEAVATLLSVGVSLGERALLSAFFRKQSWCYCSHRITKTLRGRINATLEL